MNVTAICKWEEEKFMLIKTYKLLVIESIVGISDEERMKIESILSEISDNDYCLSIDPTPFNSVCKYTLSIIILRRGLEDAEKIAKEISDKLLDNGIVTKRVESSLLWDEENAKFYYPIE